MGVTSHVVAKFGFHPTFCHFETYTRAAKFNYEKLEYEPVKGAEAEEWEPGQAGTKLVEGTKADAFPNTKFNKIRPDRAVPTGPRPAVKVTGVRPRHWIYVFSALRGSKNADWYAELFALDEFTTVLNPKTTRSARLGWTPPNAGDESEAEGSDDATDPPPNINHGLNGKDTFVTAVAIPYRLSDECIDALEAELVMLADFVDVSKRLRHFTEKDGSESPLQWLEIPVLHPWNVAENLATKVRAARSEHSRKNGMPGEDADGFSSPPIEPTQAESESCKQYALMSAIAALMNGNADLNDDIGDRLADDTELLEAKRSLKKRPYEQLRFHVEAELFGADLAGWLSRRLVRILMDGYIVPPGPTSTPDIEELMTSLALAAVALKYTSTGLAFLRVLRSGDWRETLLGAVAEPSAPGAMERMDHARPYADAVLAIGTVVLSARVMLESMDSRDIAGELTRLFGNVFGGDWKNSLDEQKKLISHFGFWGSGFGGHKPGAYEVKVRARRLELKMETTARWSAVTGVVEKALKVLDAINLVVAVRELHEISASNPKLRDEKMADVVFQSLDFVKSALEFALKDEKGLLRLAPRVLGVIVAARTAWKSGVTAAKALSYGDINAFAAMAVTSTSAILAIGVAAIGEAGAAAAHFGAIVAAIGVLASLVYVWAKDTDLETFVAHSMIGDRAFESLDTGEPGWATVPLNKLASSWDNQLEALAALQGQFSLHTDATMHHADTSMHNVRLRPGILGSASRFIATWRWKAFGDASHAAMRTKTIHIEGGKGMSQDSDGLYVDLIIPTEAFNKATDAGKPIPPQLELSIVRDVYAADGVKVTLPLHGPAVMDCIRYQKASAETIESMHIVKPEPDDAP